MRITFFSLLGFAFCAAIFTAQAGPPLICHPYDIGNAQSLPWGHGRDAVGFDNPNPNYNIKQLTTDTLKILHSSAPVLVRMETIPRASLYDSTDHTPAHPLLKPPQHQATHPTP